jgi:hypothetical protein
MTRINWERLIERGEAMAHVVEPYARKVGKIVVFGVTLCFGGALTLVSAGTLVFTAAMLDLPDAELGSQLSQLTGDLSSVSDQRDALTILGAIAVAALIWGLHTLYGLLHSVQYGKRIAELENQLEEVELHAGLTEHWATDLAVDAESMGKELAEFEELFSIPGVIEAARKAARNSLNPDAHPGADDDEIHDLAARFAMAEAVFDRFSN